jgi:sulfatase modifying factor 1
MNITIQTIVNAKVKHTNSLPFQSIPSSSTRMRLDDDRVILNKIKPLDKVLFKAKNMSFHMICCPSGAFTMGTDDQYDNPKRTEQIEHSFLLGETEVTQELYQAVMGYDESFFNNDSKNPVEMVTWFDAVMFCNKLSQLLGKNPYYLVSNIKLLEEYDNTTNNIVSADVEINPNANGFRLPTEKEWEYAAKAGTENEWAGCDSDEDLKDYAWFKENSNYATDLVKTKKPNEWGFYDMSGNVWEWCWDQYDSISGSRVGRGGSWDDDAESLRSAYRATIPPDNRDQGIGFRVSASL